MKPALLYLTHRIPYPPNKGDKIRSYHMLRFLSRYYRIFLGTFVDSEQDWQYRDVLATLCEGNCYFAPLRPNRARLKSLINIFRPPLTLAYYRQHKFQKWVERIIEDHQIVRVLVFSSALAQYVEKQQSLRRVMDFVDMDSDKWLQYSKSKTWPAKWVYKREGVSLLAYEKKIANMFDVSFFVSRAERDLFHRRAPESKDRVTYFNMGVDADYFSPERGYVNPYANGAPIIVFTGAMDYWANVDAVTWFAESIFPLVRSAKPDTLFYIVGARPHSAVLKLAKLPGITVTGQVEDIRPYLAHARVCVAPLRIARGVQSKILEGMAMQKIIVASQEAAAAIEATPGREFLVANNADDFARTVVMALNREQPTDMASAARRTILEKYDWQANLSALLSALQ